MVRLSIIVLLLALIPAAIEFFISRKEFPVHSTGAIIVTGASTGIGRDAAIAISKLGYITYACVRKEKDALSIQDENISNLKPLLLDVVKDDSIDSAYEVVEKELLEQDLPLIGLVNNAGIALMGQTEFHDIQDFRDIMEVNYFGLVQVTKKFLPLIRKGQGRIINISSIVGLICFGHHAAYASSKFALEAFSDVLRIELTPLNVSVSVVEPGMVVTPIFTKVMKTKLSVDNDVLYDAYPYLKPTTVDTETLDPTESDGSYANVLQERIDRGLFHTTEATTKPILDALFNKFPLTRYPCAGINGVPSKVLLFFRWLLPDRAFDVFMNFVNTKL